MINRSSSAGPIACASFPPFVLSALEHGLFWNCSMLHQSPILFQSSSQTCETCHLPAAETRPPYPCVGEFLVPVVLIGIRRETRRVHFAAVTTVERFHAFSTLSSSACRAANARLMFSRFVKYFKQSERKRQPQSLGG
jgi:hypothetical protein